MISRRSFLLWSGALGATAAVGAWELQQRGLSPLGQTALAAGEPPKPVIIPQQCTYNCGGYACYVRLEVTDGVITRVDTDNLERDGFPAMRACQRGRSLRQFVYHPDRLKEPMKRVGKRGEGKFQVITWEEAYDTVAKKLDGIIQKYSNDAIWPHYASGTDGFGRGCVNRLLNLKGGYVGQYGSYSSACYSFAMPYTYGSASNNSADDLLNSKLVVMFGDNPAETRTGGCNEFSWFLKAKKAGVRFIVVDPRLSDSAKVLADDWIPIKPSTDNALFDAMAYVMITENLHDKAFLDKYCIGFDEAHLPAGAPRHSSYESYVFGQSDGVAKSPQWAEAITGIPKERIAQLAREIAGTKPCALLQGWAFQRAAYGEQPVRGLNALACMTGNVGKSGGGPGGNIRSGHRSTPSPSFPAGTNPVKASLSCYQWPDAITNGPALRAKDGLRGVEQLKSSIKFIWNYGGNTLINQHSDCNATARLLADESLVEFILVHDIFMTPSARFADILLPDKSFVERLHTGRGADDVMGDRYYLGMPAIKPLGNCKDAYEVCTGIAEKLGLKEKYTEGKSWEDWIKQALGALRTSNPGFPTYEELQKDPVVRARDRRPLIAYEKFVQDPVKNKLTTPSGKIEIYSATLAKMGQDWGLAKELPGIPKYVPAWEGPQDPLIAKFPLQCIGHHTKRRVHSTHDNNPWMEEVEPQMVWINDLDAKARGIRSGDKVEVFNDRGKIHLPAFVTRMIMPGVVSIPQGAWYTPDKNGVDIRGCINTITRYKPTPGAKGNPQHTNLVEIVKL